MYVRDSKSNKLRNENLPDLSHTYDLISLNYDLLTQSLLTQRGYVETLHGLIPRGNDKNKADGEPSYKDAVGMMKYITTCI